MKQKNKELKQKGDVGKAAKIKADQPMRVSFSHFISSPGNKRFLWVGLIVGVIYFIILRLLYPIPIYYPDSFTYIQAARDNQAVSFRPVQYSEIIRFFKAFSDSDFALILGQYCSNIIANLFLFFSVTYFFNFSKFNRWLIFILLLCNPLYLFYSNFVLSDSFFNSLTVAWFTLLIWGLYRPGWLYPALQLVLLLVLFKLRYHAIIFPAFIALALILSKQALWRKVLIIVLNVVVIGGLILNMINKTEELTGTRTFSAFGGWQMANNAMYVLCNEKKLDTTSIESGDARDALLYTTHFLDTTKEKYDIADINGGFMWNKNSPLKKYIDEYARKNFYRTYFETWNALGPVYSDVGKTVILQQPMAYIKYFVIPNAGQYMLPPFEAYEKYKEKEDTIPKVVQDYYQYKNNKTGENYPLVYSVVFKPWYYIFPVINVAFILVALFYFFSKSYKNQPLLFNKTLLCFAAFYIANFLFVVLLAPSTFRYHVFIITLLIPLITWFLQQLIKPVKQIF